MPPGGVERSRVMWGLRRLVDDVVATVVPGTCKACEGPLDGASTVPVCGECVASVQRERMPACGVCGEGVDLDAEMEDVRFAQMSSAGLQCRECRMVRPEFARAVAFGEYAGVTRVMIHLLKFARVRRVAKKLGGKLAEAVLELEGEAAGKFLVVAVPLFKARERQRGYNQSVLLAGEAVQHLRRLRPAWALLEAHGTLRRQRSTESSFVLSRKGRRRNLQGAFVVRGDVQGREVLLVDDILTTGATARECARVLMQAGAAKVWVATVARTQKKFVQRQRDEAAASVAKWDLGVSGTGG